MPYGWVIDIDLVSEATQRVDPVSIFGPSNIDPDVVIKLQAGEGRAFRMRDGDSIVYYEGRLIGGDGFEPLDDYGTPDSGCTSIEYLEDGKWEIL